MDGLGELRSSATFGVDSYSGYIQGSDASSTQFRRVETLAVHGSAAADLVQISILQRPDTPVIAYDGGGSPEGFGDWLSIVWYNGIADPVSSAGGEGADLFRYAALRDSRGGALDTITDFHHDQRDIISFEWIDADSTIKHDQAFTFIDRAAFSGLAGTGGELRQQIGSDGTITVQGDVDHDGVADFSIAVHTDQPLVAQDLIL